MSKRNVTRYYYGTYKTYAKERKELSALKRITKAEAEKILKEAGFTLDDINTYKYSQSITVKHVGKRKHEWYDQNWYVLRTTGTLIHDDYCDEGLEI